MTMAQAQRRYDDTEPEERLDDEEREAAEAADYDRYQDREDDRDDRGEW
jgi:hypothetical protein